MSETAAHLSAAHASDAAPPAIHTGDRSFAAIAAKVRAGVPLDRDDGVALYRHRDLLGLGALANEVRERLHGDRTYFNVNLHINPTNVCEADCKFCSFARLTPDMPQAYTMTGRAGAAEGDRAGAPADHRGARGQRAAPGSAVLVLHGYPARAQGSAPGRAPEGVHGGRDPLLRREVRDDVRGGAAGADRGGPRQYAGRRGRDLRRPRARRKICRDKADARQWLEVHRTAHRLGLRTNCTMLYGTVETLEERVEHMLALRELQAETGGFQTFIPLAFHNEHNDFSKLPEPTGVDDLRTYAVARLMLHNIPHIKAYWVMIGVKTAQIALSFGVDDLDGTVQEEKWSITWPAQTRRWRCPARSWCGSSAEAGRTAVERDTLYGVRWVDDGAPLPEIRMDASVPFSGHSDRAAARGALSCSSPGMGPRRRRDAERQREMPSPPLARGAP